MPKVDDDDDPEPVTVAEPLNGHTNDDGIQVGINFLDLGRLSPFIRESFFGPGCKRLDGKRGAIRIDRDRPDEAAVAFAKGVSLLEAACLCDVIRSHDRKVGDFPTRVYLFRKAWTKLPSAALLSVMSNGRPILNPALFDVQLEPGEAEPPPQESIDFGDPCGADAGKQGDA